MIISAGGYSKPAIKNLDGFVETGLIKRQFKNVVLMSHICDVGPVVTKWGVTHM